jgi:hypothetical protein
LEGEHHADQRRVVGGVRAGLEGERGREEGDEEWKLA